MAEETSCVFCGFIISGEYGNNAYPLFPDGKCCNNCNFENVVCVRMRISRMNDEEKEEFLELGRKYFNKKNKRDNLKIVD